MVARLVPIIPRGLPKAAGAQQAMINAAKQVGKQMEKDLAKTTDGWDTRVTFRSDVTTTGGKIVVTVGTDNAIYGYVSRGTKPHVIRPKQSKFLRFQRGYSPRTSSRTTRRKGTGRSSGGFVYAKQVSHPGTKARNFEAKIAVRYQDILPAILQRALIKHAGGG